MSVDVYLKYRHSCKLKEIKMSVSKRALIIWIVILIISWELIARVLLHDLSLIPSFSKVVKTLFDELINGNLLETTKISMLFAIKGYSISVVMSIIVAMLCIKSYIIKSFFATLYKILSPLPSVAILPVILIVSGLNSNSIILLIIHSVFWPMLSSNMMGFSTIPIVLSDFSKNIQMSFISRVFYVYIPSSISHIITGMRTAWGRAWRSLISAEAIFGISGNTQGIGYYIYYHRSFANMTNVFAGIIIIIIISLIIEELFSFIEKQTIAKWGMKNVR